jgi:hypothetical protein
LNKTGVLLQNTFMPRVSSAVESLPAAASAALVRLGADLAVARKRRKQPLREWAARLNVSVPTLMKMEKGDPQVAAGVYATALWLINRHAALGQVADPKEDVGALEADVGEASRRHRRTEQPGG